MYPLFFYCLSQNNGTPAMTKTTQTLLIIAVIALIATTGALLYLFNENKQVTEQQAIVALDEGIALFYQKKYAESLETLQGIPDGVITDWHLPYYTATAHVMLKNYEAAAPILEQALEINPQGAEIMFELGVVYFKLGNLSSIERVFCLGIGGRPNKRGSQGIDGHHG